MDKRVGSVKLLVTRAADCGCSTQKGWSPAPPHDTSQLRARNTTGFILRTYVSLATYSSASRVEGQMAHRPLTAESTRVKARKPAKNQSCSKRKRFNRINKISSQLVLPAFKSRVFFHSLPTADVFNLVQITFQ